MQNKLLNNGKQTSVLFKVNNGTGVSKGRLSN